MLESNRRRPYSFGPLYDLLVEKFPNHRTVQGVFDVPGFARDLNRSHEAVYKAVRQNRLTPDMARRIIELSEAKTEEPEKRVTKHDLTEYLFSE